MHLLEIIAALVGVVAVATVAIGHVKHCHLPRRKPRVWKAAAVGIAAAMPYLAAGAEKVLALAPVHFTAKEWNLDLYGTGSIANEKRSKDDVVFGGGLGLTYWATRGLGFGLSGETDNLVGGFEHSVFDRALGRVSVRAPLWDRIAPYGYCEGGYAFERDRFIAGAGGGLDFRLAKGWALFGEAGLQVSGAGEGGAKGKAGVRLCW